MAKWTMASMRAAMMDWVCIMKAWVSLGCVDGNVDLEMQSRSEVDKKCSKKECMDRRRKE
jgi:hypothetical protein